MISLAFAMCISYKEVMKIKKMLFLTVAVLLLAVVCSSAALAAEGDVAGAIEETWDAASDQIKTVVDNVVFPALDMILAIAFSSSGQALPSCWPA